MYLRKNYYMEYLFSYGILLFQIIFSSFFSTQQIKNRRNFTSEPPVRINEVQYIEIICYIIIIIIIILIKPLP